MTNSTSTKSLRLPLPAENARRHWTILLIATLIVQGVMFVSYPLGTVNYDDDQAAQLYMMGELADGNILIGNLRYTTGYAFLMGPVRSLTRSFGQAGDRALLLIQMTAYSTIPFMIYDIMRRRFKRRTALITALVVLVDPYGLQWAHLHLPGWLIALTTVWALWLAQLAWSTNPRRRLMLITLASIGLGLMVLVRFNFAPVVAVFGLSFFLCQHIPVRHRLALFVLVGAISSGILAAYLMFVHLPSTGTTKLSCIAALNIGEGVYEKGIFPNTANGPHSARYAKLLSLPTELPNFSTPELYTHWRNPNSWLGEAEKRAFLAQPSGKILEEVPTRFPGELYWYLGPCALDDLLRDVLWETIAANEAELLLGILKVTADSLVQNGAESYFDYMYIDRADNVSWQGESRLGFERAESRLYNGHRVWRPGMILFSALFTLVNTIKFLTPLAMIAAFWKRDWLLVLASTLLLAGLVLLATVTNSEPRHFAMLAPLYSILIGWFLAQILERILASRSSDR